MTRVASSRREAPGVVRSSGPRKSLVDPEVVRKQMERPAPNWDAGRNAGDSAYYKVFGARLPGQPTKKMPAVRQGKDGVPSEYLSTGTAGSMEKGEIDAMTRSSGIRRLPFEGEVAGKDNESEFL